MGGCDLLNESTAIATIKRAGCDWTVRLIDRLADAAIETRAILLSRSNLASIK